MKRYSVLSFIINNYEFVREIDEKDPEAEYILVTDNPNLKSETWTIIYDEELANENTSAFYKCWKVRYNPFKYCTTDICIRLDGSIKIKKSLKPLIDIFEECNYDMSLMPHPERYNFIDEYNAWVSYRNYSPKQVLHNLDIMRQLNYTFDYNGLFQLNYSIVRNTEEQNQLNKLCFELLLKLGGPDGIERVDQIPFSMIMNQQYTHLKVLPVSGQIVNSEYMQWCLHNSTLPIHNHTYNLKEKDIKYMFDEPVECLYLI